MEQTIYSVVKELLRKAACDLPGDVEQALVEARKGERSEIAKAQLDAILENVKLARSRKVPMCQDTGIPVFYVSVGDGSDAEADVIRDSINRAVADATKEIPLRPNVVHPLTRKNTGNNSGFGFPYIEFDFVKGRAVEITAKPVGCGCETGSILEMLKPTAGEDEIVESVVGFVKDMGGKTCPPCVLGIALGGTADLAMKEAKKQTLRLLGRGKGSARGEENSALEKKLLEAVNKRGAGAMGLGGSNTALAVHVKELGAHTAMLPLAINTCCWACRRASAKIEGGEVGYF